MPNRPGLPSNREVSRVKSPFSLYLIADDCCPAVEYDELGKDAAEYKPDSAKHRTDRKSSKPACCQSAPLVEAGLLINVRSHHQARGDAGQNEKPEQKVV
jgi:hypothetical protein